MEQSSPDSALLHCPSAVTSQTLTCSAKVLADAVHKRHVGACRDETKRRFKSVTGIGTGTEIGLRLVATGTAVLIQHRRGKIQHTPQHLGCFFKSLLAFF